MSVLVVALVVVAAAAGLVGEFLQVTRSVVQEVQARQRSAVLLQDTPALDPRRSLQVRMQIWKFDNLKGQIVQIS